MQQRLTYFAAPNVFRNALARGPSARFRCDVRCDCHIRMRPIGMILRQRFYSKYIQRRVSDLAAVQR